MAGFTSERRNAERRSGNERRSSAQPLGSGRGIAEMLDPAGEEAYWRENYASQSFYEAGLTYDDYHPGYRTGWEGRARHEGPRFERVRAERHSPYERGATGA